MSNKRLVLKEGEEGENEEETKERAFEDSSLYWWKGKCHSLKEQGEKLPSSFPMRGPDHMLFWYAVPRNNQ